MKELLKVNGDFDFRSRNVSLEFRDIFEELKKESKFCPNI